MKKAQNYTIQLEHRGDYLYAFVKGDKLTAEISKNYRDEIAVECQRRNLTRVMFEREFVESVSVGEMLQMGIYLSEAFAGKKIAFLDRRPNPDINNFGQKVAVNRGVNMKVFNDPDEAADWLLA